MAPNHPTNHSTTDSGCQLESGPSGLRSRWAVLFAGGLVVAVGLATYSNSFWGPFVFDDLDAIVYNSSIRELKAIGRVLSPPVHGQTVSGRPLLNLSLAVNYAIGGTSTRSYHAVNLAIHLLNGLLLLAILCRTFCSSALRSQFGNAALGLALAIAILWVLHPLQTESVTYIVQRAESLGALFYLLTLYAVIRGSQSTRPFFWHALAVIACFLGVATKETVVTAPLVVLLYDRTFLAGSFHEALRRRWGLYAGLLASWALLIWLVWSTGLLEHREEAGALDAWSYAQSQPGVVLHYVRLSLWPHPLCLDYDWPAARTIDAVLPGLLVVGILASATLWGMIRRHPWAFLGAWFLVILSPSSSVAPLGQLAFEHRMYLPLAAVLTTFVLVAYRAGQSAISRGWMPTRVARAVSACLVVAVGTAWGLLTVERNRVYSSDLSLWQDTVTKAPHNPRAHNSLGLLLAKSGRLAEAIEHYQESIRLKPQDALTHNNLGVALADSKRPLEAIEQFREAVRLNPRDADAHCNWGDALQSEGRLPEAIEHYDEAIRIKPDSGPAHYNLGNALSAIGRQSEAIGQYEQALKADPDQGEVHNNLAMALAQTGRIPEAIEHFEEAIHLNPQLAGARYNLALALLRGGRIPEALEQGEAAIRLAPDRPDVNRLLAWLMATREVSEGGNPGRAVELAKRACTLTGHRHVGCLDALAAAYASAGRFDEALSTAKEAWQMAQAGGQVALAEGIHIRLQLYRDRKPFRQPVGTASGRF